MARYTVSPDGKERRTFWVQCRLTREEIQLLQRYIHRTHPAGDYSMGDALRDILEQGLIVLWDRMLADETWHR
jgi:hypothetical protein